jgi:GDP-D-mannose dehydratase
VDNDVRYPRELSAKRSNVTEAEQFLRWRAHIAMPDVVDAMVPAQTNRLREA